MIPNAYLIEWRNHVPWKTMDMVEQDLLISRAIVDIFRQYMNHEGHSVSQTEYQANLDAKLANPSFVGDVDPLVSADLDYSIETAADLVSEELIQKL